jgi:hypothetical protein
MCRRTEEDSRIPGNAKRMMYAASPIEKLRKTQRKILLEARGFFRLGAGGWAACSDLVGDLLHQGLEFVAHKLFTLQ